VLLLLLLPLLVVVGGVGGSHSSNRPVSRACTAAASGTRHFKQANHKTSAGDAAHPAGACGRATVLQDKGRKCQQKHQGWAKKHLLGAS
jgi:hypothetical protein